MWAACTWLDTGNLPHAALYWAPWKAEVSGFQTPWPDSGIASRKKCEILLTLRNYLLEGKNYKAIWEATSRSVEMGFGGCFLPLEKQDGKRLRPLRLGDGLEPLVPD